MAVSRTTRLTQSNLAHLWELGACAALGFMHPPHVIFDGVIRIRPKREEYGDSKPVHLEQSNFPKFARKGA